MTARLEPPVSQIPTLLGASRGRAAGFTLVELLVAFTIMALALAILPVAYDKLTQAVTYQASIRDFVSDVSAARLQAMASGRSVALFVNPSAKTFGVSGQAPRHWPSTYAVSVTVANQEISAGQVAHIRFYPDGSATGGTVTVLRAPNNGIHFRVDWLTGRLTQVPVSSDG